MPGRRQDAVVRQLARAFVNPVGPGAAILHHVVVTFAGGPDDVPSPALVAAWEKLGMAGLAAVVVARHAGNLARLASGDEPALEREP